MEIERRASLDAAALAEQFNQGRRLQIKDILEAPVAERLYQSLVDETPWLTAYREDGQDRMITEKQLRDMGPEKIQAMQQKVWQQARDAFGFMYSCYPLMDERLKTNNSDLFLYKWVEFINSDKGLDFFRQVTGLSSLVRADAQGTWYRKGQFLTPHNDYDPSDTGKRIAYVLNLSRNWRPEWGGFLQFYDDDLNIEAGHMPRFNTISLFETPQNHSVTYVTPFCGNRRLAITGWFRDQ